MLDERRQDIANGSSSIDHMNNKDTNEIKNNCLSNNLEEDKYSSFPSSSLMNGKLGEFHNNSERTLSISIFPFSLLRVAWKNPSLDCK